jgi:hypothetical protein
VRWDNPADKAVVGTELLREIEEQMVKIKQNLKASQDRKKCYVDNTKNHNKFLLGDHVFLKVNAKKISLKLENCSKLEAH